jgi:hypothetical protein
LKCLKFRQNADLKAILHFFTRISAQSQLRIQQLEQEIAVLKQRNTDLTMCLDEAVAHIHRLSPRTSARIVAEIEKLKPRGKPPQPYVQEGEHPNLAKIKESRLFAMKHRE